MWSEVADAFKAALAGQWGSAGVLSAALVGVIWLILSIAQRLLPWAINRDTIRHKSQVDSYNHLEDRLEKYQDQLINCRGKCTSLKVQLDARDKVIADQIREIIELRAKLEKTE